MATIIAFIFILGVIVLVHEWGHFWAARRFGVKVEEFAFGFPPRLVAKKKGDTLYALNLIPLGGYVKIFGENEADMKEPGSFASQAIWKRALILGAGVVMNIILAFILLSIVVGFGVPTAFHGAVPEGARNPTISIIEVAQNSPAQEAGIQSGDGVVSIRVGEDVFMTQNVINDERALDIFGSFVKAHAGKEISMIVRRADTEREVSLVPRIEPPPSEGALGITMIKTAIVQVPWYRAPLEGFKATFELLRVFVVALSGIVRDAIIGGELQDNLTGPVGIVRITSQTVSLGIIFVLQLTAILSLNVALINILPFPALDGGRLVFLLIEKIRGRPVKREVEQWVNTAGFILLIVLVIFITIKDIHRFF